MLCKHSQSSDSCICVESWACRTEGCTRVSCNGQYKECKRHSAGVEHSGMSTGRWYYKSAYRSQILVCIAHLCLRAQGQGYVLCGSQYAIQFCYSNCWHRIRRLLSTRATGPHARCSHDRLTLFSHVARQSADLDYITGCLRAVC